MMVLTNVGFQVHLHGNVFQVVGRGNGTYDSSIQLNTTNPMRRDTISVPGQGFTVIRFRADNPGVWVGFHSSLSYRIGTYIIS